MTDVEWKNLTCPSSNMEDLNHQFIECIRDFFYFQHITEATRQKGLWYSQHTGPNIH